MPSRRSVAVGFRTATPIAAVVAALAVSPGATAKTCRHGYTHAVIHNKQDCLHAGEYCSHAYERQYLRYHFTCRVVHGVYRLERH